MPISIKHICAEPHAVSCSNIKQLVFIRRVQTYFVWRVASS